MKRHEIEALQSLNKIEKSKMLRYEELRAACDHKKEKHGETVSALRHIGQDGEQVYECSICHTKINLSEVPREEIKSAARTIKNVINSIKAAEDDMPVQLREQLGAMILLMDKLPNAYDSIVVEKFHEEDRSFNTNFNQYQGAPGFQQMGHIDPRFSSYMHNPIMGSMNYGKKKGKKNKGGNGNKKKKRGYEW